MTKTKTKEMLQRTGSKFEKVNGYEKTKNRMEGSDRKKGFTQNLNKLLDIGSIDAMQVIQITRFLSASKKPNIYVFIKIKRDHIILS